MAKKDKRVVVSEAYLDLLIEKADMLDGMFEFSRVRVEEGDFKIVRKFHKRFDKINIDRQNFEEK